MRTRDKSALIDMFVASMRIVKFMSGFNIEQFHTDDRTQSAVIRQLQIIGEATARIAQDVKNSNPNISWKAMLGLRNTLIHAYHRIDIDEIWGIIQTDVPKLIVDLRAIPSLNPDDEIDLK